MRFNTAPASNLLSSALIACGAFACGQSAAPADDLILSSAAQPIFGGSLDREHPEVMFLFDLAGSACTGTNIRTDSGSGFLLTAAHCVTVDVPGPGVQVIDPERFVVVTGEDVFESTEFFPAEAIAVEPGYVGAAADDDIAIVRYFFGNQSAPPTIEPLTPGDDDVQVDDDLLLVGYGQTEDGGQNTERRSVARSVGDLDDELIAFSQADGRGACFGDSGGPGLVQLDGQERVGLVISTGISDNPVPCIDGLTLGMRVSAYADFIQDVFDAEL
jgi:secreted trypsin-like serine protease